MKHGIIVDLETTGIDPLTDKIIEIGILEFCIKEPTSLTITNMYSGLEDPHQPLSDEIKKLTGLDDPQLAGKKIDWDIVNPYFERSSIIIAHNAQFDRSFLRARDEMSLQNLHWGCSVNHIDWAAHGYKTRALTYLAADHGFVNPFAHRALFDCATTFRLIAPHFDELLTNSFKKDIKVKATGATYSTKDHLKEKKYYWDKDNKYWFKIVSEDRLEEERRFLREEVYFGADMHEEEDVSLN
jgi:DNA polymerase-3 subunit epsilon